jgi:hypothetical protein
MTDTRPATHSAVVTEPARKRSPWVRRGAHLIGYTLTLFVGVAIGLPSTPAAPAAPAPVAPSAATEVPTTVTAPPITVQAAPPATVAPEPAPATSGTSFGPGTWGVGAGDEVAPGTYRSAGVDPDASYPMCRATTRTGEEIDQLELAAEGPVRIIVKEGQTVTTSGCQTFAKVG